MSKCTIDEENTFGLDKISDFNIERINNSFPPLK